MPDVFGEDVPLEEFSLPGDDERLARASEQQPEPAPVVEAAAAAAEPVVEEPAAVAAEEPVVEEPATEEQAGPVTIEVDLSDPEVARLVAKYGGDVSKALAAGAELQSLVGRQGNELGELRRLMEERVNGLEERVHAANEPQYDPDELTVWMAEHPTAIPDIARQAFYAGNDALMDLAVGAWEDVDRGAARRFSQEAAVARARTQMQAEGERNAQIASGWNQTAERFAEEHPDLETHAPRMREIAPQFPNLISILQTGDPQSRIEVLEFLYEKAKGSSAEEIQTSAREIARTQANEATQAIKDAAVASATTAQRAPSTTVAERIAEAWDTARAPYEEGWNV